MLTIYKTTAEGLEQLESMANGTWINAIDPTPDEIEKLINWGIDVDYINYSLDLDEMPRIEREEDYTFILLRIPHSQPEEDIPYITIPLGIMIRGNTIVTICRYDKDMFKVLAEGKYRSMKTGKRYRLTLYIFLESAVRYLTHLREINRMTEIVEDQLQKSTRNRELLELFKYQKSLTYFATALRANEVMMERVQRMQIFKHYEEDQDLLEDRKPAGAVEPERPVGPGKTRKQRQPAPHITRPRKALTQAQHHQQPGETQDQRRQAEARQALAQESDT